MSDDVSRAAAHARGFARLLDHCIRLEHLTAARVSSRDRLEDLVGGDFARSLVGALAGDHCLQGRLYTPDTA